VRLRNRDRKRVVKRKINDTMFEEEIGECILHLSNLERV